MDPKTPQQIRRSKILLWAFNLAAVFAYVLIGRLLIQNRVIEPLAPQLAMILLIVFIAVSILGLLVLLRLRAKRHDTTQDLKNQMGLYPLELALAESMVVYGLVYAVLTGQMVPLLIFSAVSIISLIIAHPFKERQRITEPAPPGTATPTLE
ncbi:hypothetical protein IH979_03520 [Patescibacteria group bacterium]|nr:hypothetical protein [Patescibacteria group bacterium]